MSVSVAAGRSLLCRTMSGTLGSQYSPCFAFRACLVEVLHVTAAVTRLGLPVIRNQNTVSRNCKIGRYMLIKSDFYDTYHICYCVTVNICSFLLLHSSDFSVELKMCAQRAFVYFWGSSLYVSVWFLGLPFLFGQWTLPYWCVYIQLCLVWRMSCAYCISTN